MERGEEGKEGEKDGWWKGRSHLYYHDESNRKVWLA